MGAVKRWLNKPFGVMDVARFLRVSAMCEFREWGMWGQETFLRRCAVCHRKNGTGHKMSCYREYTREVLRGKR